jgi:hypothetical protein
MPAGAPSKLNPSLAFIGERLDGEPEDELGHFYLCQACQQPVDKRDLAAVFHHEQPGHGPLRWQDAERLLHISAQLGGALQGNGDV